MTTNRELDEILAQIGREHRAIDAPERLESILFAAADNKKNASAAQRLRFSWILATVSLLIAAVVIAGTIWQIRKQPQPGNQQVQSAPVPQVRAESASPASVGAKKSITARSTPAAKTVTNRARRPNSPPKQPSWSALDEFVPLPVSEGLAPAADLSVVRIKLKGSDLQQYGLEAPADAAAQTMLAEFVVGEDGLPRAIRIVR